MSRNLSLPTSLAAALIASLVATTALAQGHAGHGSPPAQPPAPQGHGGHTMGGQAAPQAAPAPGGHQGHGAAAPSATGDWAYVGRDNPKPTTRNRWVMVPGEGGAMYRSAKDMTPDQRCKALLGNPRIIVDAATREACGDTSAPPAPSAQPSGVDHSKHH